MYEDMITEYDSKKYYVGARFKVSHGYEVEIVGKMNGKSRISYVVEFMDGSGYRMLAQTKEINNGWIKNPAYEYTRLKSISNDKEIEVLRRYYITTCGRVFSNKKDDVYKELKTRIREDGYTDVGLIYNENGDRQPFMIHRLVALKYLDSCPYEKRIVNHKDTNKKNNSICNLEWTTVSLNTQHGFDNYCYDSIDNILVKDKIKNENKVFPTMYSALRFYGIPTGNSGSIIKNGKYFKMPNLSFERVK